MAAMSALLEVQGLSKHFGGVLALDELNLTVAANEILGLIGPNGSGKTTFFNVITGIYRVDAGSVFFNGADVTNASGRAMYQAGMARTFQRSRLSLPLSIFDNIMIGNHKRLNQGLWFNLVRRGDFKRQFEESYAAARALVEVFEPGLADRLFEPVAGLPMIDRRRIEICRALISAPRLLLLDEPSAGMTHEETAELMNDILLVRARNKDLTIIIVEHEMGVIERRRAVPHRGFRRAGAGSLSRGGMMSGTLEIEDVFTAYDKADVLQGVSLKVEPGRITCLLGSNGSGKTTLVRSILGLTPSRLGRIVFDGADITRLPTHKIIAAGIACIPEGRKVFPKLTVEENLRVGAYQERSDKVSAARLDEILNIFPRLSERRTQLAGTMSGGEQAMVSIGRGLMCAPKLLLIDEPSLGLSPRLVKENFSIIRSINERGITVLLVEQNVHQTLAISHYGFVLSKGRVAASGTPTELAARQDVRDAYFG
jgi:branched-chain amino acid transport system ATP-binding protein